jgi:hypothetical protein
MDGSQNTNTDGIVRGACKVSLLGIKTNNDRFFDGFISSGMKGRQEDCQQNDNDA